MNTDILLKVKGLTLAFGAGTPAVVEDVSFSLQNGKTLALVGESGSGKSLSALSIVRLLPPNAELRSGVILYRDKNVMQAKESELRSIRGGKIGLIFQEPMTSLNPLHTIGKQLEEAITLHLPLKGKALQQRMMQLLDEVELEGLQHRLDDYPHLLSGGQRQRLMIGIALAANPEILIADEPTTALDVTVQANILALLDRLKRERNMALLLITHDLAIVRHMADTVAVMQKGKIVEQGSAKQLFAEPQHPYTQKLLNAEPARTPPALKADAELLLEAKDVSVHFTTGSSLFGMRKQSFTAVEEVSVKLYRGMTLGLVGESGSGKSTLGNALLRLIPSSGEIIFNGMKLHEKGAKEMRHLRKRMQVVFQDPYASLNPRLSVGQIIEEGLIAHGIGDNRSARKELAVTALQDAGLEAQHYDRYPHQFSGGQRQRIGIARALALEPELVVLDEPTSALDISTQVAILKLLRKLQEERGLSYLFISHDLRVIRAVSHEVAVMKAGRIVEHGTAQQLFENPREEYTKRLLSAALEFKQSA